MITSLNTLHHQTRLLANNIEILKKLSNQQELIKYSATYDEMMLVCDKMHKIIDRYNDFIECEDDNDEDTSYHVKTVIPNNQGDNMLFDECVELFNLLKKKPLHESIKLIGTIKQQLNDKICQ